nr:hypothetical protein [Tanacetum cinerariifolium]
MDTCIALSRRVEHLELDKIAQALEITKLKRRVKKLERRNKVKVLKLRRLQEVGTSQRINTSDDTVMEDVSSQGRMIADMDADADVVLEEVKEVVADAKADQEEAKVNESVDIQGRTAESQAKIYKIDLDHANNVLSMQVDETEPSEVQKAVDVVTTAKIITEVVTTASTTITAAEVLVPAATTTAIVPKLTAAPRRRTKGVVIRDPEESSTTTSTIISAKTKSKDKGKRILVEEPKLLKKQAQIEQDKKYSKELKAELNRTIDWDEVMEHVKMKAKEDPAAKRSLKRINETLAEKAAKRKKLDEEVEELKRHLQIVPNEDDDVYTEATPLARKVPVVDYEVINMNNKPYYKIIRADDTHQFYTCSNLEESKKCTWSSKSQRLEAAGIMWCVDHNIYNYTANFVSGEEVPTHKVHSGLDAKCSRVMVEYILHQAQEQDLDQVLASAAIKKVNDVVKLRALIDGKRVVVTEDVIRQALHLDDADGVECLPNEEIFRELARMGYEKLPPKLTFYKAFFSPQWKF